MATQDYAASIQGVSIRVTRLDAAGNLLTGPADSYTTSAFMRVSFTPEYEEGDEITEKGANGVVVVSYKAPDTLKRITMELAIAEPDAELSALISGGLLLRKDLSNDGTPNVKSIGWAAPGVGDDPAGNGVAIEAWSFAVANGKRASAMPYFHWVFPFVKMRQSGDRVIENGMLATTFEGYGLGNTQFGAGIDGRWEFPTAAERPYSYARAAWAPTGLAGFYTWSDNATDQVVFTGSGNLNATTINVASYSTYTANNVVSLNFSAAPAIAASDTIKVSGFGNPAVDGTYTVANVAGNAVAYVSTPAGNVTANTAFTGVNGTARVQLLNSVTEARVYPVATTTITDGTVETGVATTSYNVPGGKYYVADNAIDNIIISNETGINSTK